MNDILNYFINLYEPNHIAIILLLGLLGSAIAYCLARFYKERDRKYANWFFNISLSIVGLISAYFFPYSISVFIILILLTCPILERKLQLFMYRADKKILLLKQMYPESFNNINERMSEFELNEFLNQEQISSISEEAKRSLKFSFIFRYILIYGPFVICVIVGLLR
ncbi:MAG: hypothetical protein E7254_06225 [Lachnospiraceae bacterium]|jgi:hypothetical protein|nr:hypothetical protein [Lachnospiraceae bacterium]